MAGFRSRASRSSTTKRCFSKDPCRVPRNGSAIDLSLRVSASAKILSRALAIHSSLHDGSWLRSWTIASKWRGALPFTSTLPGVSGFVSITRVINRTRGSLGACTLRSALRTRKVSSSKATALTGKGGLCFGAATILSDPRDISRG